MTWPAGSITTTNTDAGTDSPASARADILATQQVVNQIVANGEPMTLAGAQTITGTKAFATPPSGIPGRLLDHTYWSSVGGSLSGSYVPPAGTAYIEVELQGAGGGGAGATATTNAQAGGGGGGGGYIRFTMTAAQVGASASFSLAAGGAGGAAGSAGTTAGVSSFAGWNAAGGLGAQLPAPEYTSGASIGGPGGGYGTGTGVLLIYRQGAAGSPGYWHSATDVLGGTGGDSYLGSGGYGGSRVPLSSGAAVVGAQGGSGYGGGGGGAGTYGGGAPTGGNGGPAFLVVRAYS